MARVSFSALVEEIVGKLAGSVFQDSYGGYQIRTRVSPQNPRSYGQQLRRGEFAYIASLWRTLDSDQRASFIDAAGSPSGGFNLFVSCNVNASLVESPLITEFSPVTPPGNMAIVIDELSPPAFTIVASGAVTVVPAGFILLVFATAERGPSQIFTNPSMYQPITNFVAGSSFITPVDIAFWWNQHYGIFHDDRRICIKSCLISLENGLRYEETISCANEVPAVGNLIVDESGNAIVDFDGTYVSFP